MRYLLPLFGLISGCSQAVYAVPAPVPKPAYFYCLDVEGPPEFKAAVERAARVWNACLCLQAFGPETGILALRIKQVSEFTFPKKAIAFTFPRTSTQENTLIAVDTKTDKLILEYVITHEMGHALGLKHSDDATSIMYPEVGTKQEIKSSDVLSIKATLKEYKFGD